MPNAAAVAEAVVKYFFYFSLDEQIGFTAGLKVLAELKSRNWIQPEHRYRWIEILHKWKPRATKLKLKTFAHPEHEKGFSFPPDFDLSIWVSFLTGGDPDEVEAVVLSRILGFEDEEIANGLRVSEGTVRYRVGRGLRHLGGYVEP